MDNNPKIDPKNELPLPHDMQLPNPHDMQIAPHITHKHAWLHWLPAIFGLFIGLFVGIFILGGAEQSRDEINLKSNSGAANNISKLSLSISPTPKVSKLKILTLNETSQQIINEDQNISFISPRKYSVGGNSLNFSVGYLDPRLSTPGPRDVSSLNFRVKQFDGKKLEDKVWESYSELGINGDYKLDFSDIKKTVINGVNGYTYSCPELISQECIFLPLNKETYLFIIKKYADNFNQGYYQQLNNILATLKFEYSTINLTPTTEPTVRTFQPICTLDTKQCPDGTWVSRTGPNCEFLPCPATPL